MNEPAAQRARTGAGAGAGGRAPYRLRLPGFLTDEEVGLGEAVKRVTARAGLRPCGGCARRAAVLDRWLVFSGRRPR